MRLLALLPLTLSLSLVAQTTPTPKPAAKPAPKAVEKTEKAEAKPVGKKEAVKDSLEAQGVRQAFSQVLDSVSATWFGQPYKDIKYVDLTGSLKVTLSAAAVSAKVEQATQGLAKTSAVKEGRANIQLKSTYFANADFRSELSGDFGTLLYSRVGTKGFIYSKDLNAYTTRVDPAPSDAPLTFLGWFQQSMNDIKNVYTKGSSFKATWGKEVSLGGRSLQTVSFFAPTGAYDVKRREQSIAETLGFWKHGRLDVAFDKITRLPYQMEFTNEQQGIRTRLEIVYDGNNKVQTISLTNNSRGFEGPGSLRVAYGPDGLPSAVNGELVSQQKKIAFDLNMVWNKGHKSIASVPPATAAKKGREELETMLVVGAAGNLVELQRNGLNFRAFSLASNK